MPRDERKKSHLTPPSPTLASLTEALSANTHLSPTRARDLRSAVSRVADLLKEDPARIPLDLELLSTRLNAVNPVAAGISAKRFANIRSDFLAATSASGLKPTMRQRQPLTGPWHELMEKLATKRQRLGISRLARFAEAEGLAPQEIDDCAIDRFMTTIRAGSLYRKPNDLHRQTTVIWNEIAAAFPEVGLRSVSVRSFRAQPRRLGWPALPASFRKDVEDYLDWCSNKDPFAENARPRPLAPATVKLHRDQIHAAVSALVDSGIEPTSLGALADLLTSENFKRVARQRREMAAGQENQFNADLLKALIQIARDWAKPGDEAIKQLKRIASKLPAPRVGLTAKNKRFLRQFDDPAALARLRALPEQLWAQVRRDKKPNYRTLAKAQVALAVEFLTCMPLRIQNLSQLRFGVHIFLREERGAVSVLEIPAQDVKNGQPIEFDIRQELARMLIEYRDRIIPAVTGAKSEPLFINTDGTPKDRRTLSGLIHRVVRRHAGLELTPHQFRHLAAKILLDHSPGAYELVRQLLGHKNLKTTSNSYAGIDTRRAAAHHFRLLEQLEQNPTLSHRRRGRRPSTESKKLGTR